MGYGGEPDDGGVRAPATGLDDRRRVAFVVNGGDASAMADRGRAFAARLGPSWQSAMAYRPPGRLSGIRSFSRWLRDVRPDVVYVLDMALAGVVAGALHRSLRGGRLVIDTGDAIAALARSGGRGRVALGVTALLERFSLATADALVVRGTYHREWLAERGIEATVIPDGVDLSAFAPMDGAGARRELGVEHSLVVGLVGSSIWSPALEMTYGWDLVELLGLVKDLPVRGVLIGDGSGIAHLEGRARELGVSDRIVFAGRRPMQNLPRMLAAFDICLSTQTNDLPGNVRTTGKLPLYLACGRYILASRVGEAARVLPDEMLVPYVGTIDRDYPGRLAERVRQLCAARERLAAGAAGVAIAHKYFDYDKLTERVETVLNGVQ